MANATKSKPRRVMALQKVTKQDLESEPNASTRISLGMLALKALAENAAEEEATARVPELEPAISGAIELGDEVQDVISGVKGVVNGIIYHRTSCRHVYVLPYGKTKDNERHLTHAYDDDDLRLLKKSVRPYDGPIILEVPRNLISPRAVEEIQVAAASEKKKKKAKGKQPGGPETPYALPSR